jgi:hypothetical protein
LAPSDFHLFPKLKEHLKGQRFSCDEEVKCEEVECEEVKCEEVECEEVKCEEVECEEVKCEEVKCEEVECEEVKSAVRKWFQKQNTDIFKDGFH